MHNRASTTTGRGGPHGQPVVAPGWSNLRRFSNTAFWCTFGPRVFALDHPYWAYWASFTNFFDLLSPQYFILSPITWLITRKSAIKTRTSQNKHNSRNRGVNYKIKHINPQDWVLNTQLIHANMTMVKFLPLTFLDYDLVSLYVFSFFGMSMLIKSFCWFLDWPFNLLAHLMFHLDLHSLDDSQIVTICTHDYIF